MEAHWHTATDCWIFLLKFLNKNMRRRNPIQATCVSVDNDLQQESWGINLVFMNEHLLLFMEAIILEQLLVRTSGISSWPCFSTVCFSPMCGLTDLLFCKHKQPLDHEGWQMESHRKLLVVAPHKFLCPLRRHHCRAQSCLLLSFQPPWKPHSVLKWINGYVSVSWTSFLNVTE